MEVVEWELFGIDKRPSGMASAFSNPIYFKKRCKAFFKKLRRRINDVVTNDETLRVMLNGDLDNIEKEIGRISIKNNNDIEIIADLFMLIAHLLGWAHMDGNFYRTPIYYQTDIQRDKDLQKCANIKPSTGIYELYKRRQVVIQLLSEDNSYAAVARIMGLTASNVKALEKGDHIDKWFNETLDGNR